MKTSVIVDAGPLVAYFDRDSEYHENSQVFTLDSDFTIYRRFDRRPIPALMPDATRPS